MNAVLQPKNVWTKYKQRQQKQNRLGRKDTFTFSFQGDAMTLQLHQKSTNKGNKEPNTVKDNPQLFK